jgi:serine-type D-Ala-D-Ala carboxypeptidase (penicillin-binding protein 5/6)
MRSSRILLALLGSLLISAAMAQTAPTPDVPKAAAPAAVPVPPAPVPSGAKSWLLMDFGTGQVLAGENIDEKREPASITKVMTSYVAAAEMHNGKVKADDLVTISEKAWREGGAGTTGSFSGFDLGAKVKLSDLEKGMSIQSGNDAAIAIAEHVAGSEEAFASLMNSYAAKLGMKNSHFVNSHGLSAPNHYSTARDLAILGRAMIRDFPETYAYNAMKEYTVGSITQHNRNTLLWREGSGVDGIKTGHTDNAGYCLLASAKRGDQRFISIVMGIEAAKQSDGFRLRETGNLQLLEWGFRFFEAHTLYPGGKKIESQKVWKGETEIVDLGLAAPLTLSLPRGRYADLKPAMDVPKQLVAPIAKGQAIGKLRVSLDGKVLAERPLVALAAVEEAGFFGRLWDELWMWWESD